MMGGAHTNYSQGSYQKNFVTTEDTEITEQEKIKSIISYRLIH